MVWCVWLRVQIWLFFLKLSGTEFLPKKLEFFNYCDPDLYSAMNSPVKSGKSSRSATPQPQNGGGKGAGRPRGRPPNPRSVSPSVEDSTDADELGVKPLVSGFCFSCGLCKVAKWFSHISCIYGFTIPYHVVVLGQLETMVQCNHWCPTIHRNQVRPLTFLQNRLFHVMSLKL